MLFFVTYQDFTGFNYLLLAKPLNNFELNKFITT